MFLKNKLTKAQKEEKSAQDQIEVKGIEKRLLITNDNRLVQILKVGAVNTQLMSIKELHRLLEKYEVFLKSLNFPIVEQVISEPIDMKKYIQTQEEQLKKTKDFNRKKLLTSYIKWAKSLQSSREHVKRQRYILFSEEIKGPTMKDFEKAVVIVQEKRDQIIHSLKALDLPCESVSENEIVKLIHIFFNYENALQHRINFNDVSELTKGIPLIEEEKDIKLIKKVGAVNE